MSQSQKLKPIINERKRTMKTDTKLYYCSAQGHLWYYENNDDETPPLFYKNFGDATEGELETAEEKYCGCNDH
jgi:hypothetical protein